MIIDIRSVKITILYTQHIIEGTTRSGVEDYEAMEVEATTGDGGPGPQRCKYGTLNIV
jgi:hypothetical protein